MADEYGHNETTKGARSWNIREPKVEADQAPKGRVDLNPQDFDNLILQKGMNCMVYRTMYCPNVKSVDGAEHQIDCTLCNSSGFIDFDPIKCKVFIQTQELDKMPDVEGFVDGNTVLMSFPIGIELQYFTRIELTDFSNIYFQRILRNPDSNIDVLQYKACRVNALIDANGVRYFQDSDFAIDVNGNIIWTSGVQTRLLTFTSVPAAGTWTLTIGQVLVGSYDFTTVASAIQSDLRSTLNYPNATVTGDFSTGFLITLTGVNGLVGDITPESDLTVNGSTSVLISVTNNLAGGRHPANELPYSIHYEAPQQFRAAAAHHVNRYTQYKAAGVVESIKMQEQWYCAKEFLPKRKDRAGNELQQGPYDVRTIVTGEEDNE